MKRRQTSQTQETSTQANNEVGGIILLGLVRHTEEVKNTTWSLLQELSCEHKIQIHIIAQTILNQHQNLSESMNFCAPIFVEPQDDLLGKDVSNVTRLYRIAQIRDAQRQRVRELFFHKKASVISTIVSMDLDLWALPSADQIVHRIQHMNGMDVVCAAGNWFDNPSQQQKKLFYYDNFAYVAFPDTFGFPAHQRLIPRHFKGENVDIIPYSLSRAKRLVEEGHQGVPTQYSLFKFLQKQAAQHPSGFAPSRSCFGGLAMYRAAVWFAPQCAYNLFAMANPPDMSIEPLVTGGSHENNILRYASAKELLPCEHVVFHDCLHREAFGNPSRPHIGIDPQLVTHWKRNKDDPTKPPRKSKKSKKSKQN